MSIKTPRLIRDRCGVYYFRLIVPIALRELVGKLELRRSLRTKDATEARLKALELSLRVEDFLKPKLSDFPHLQMPDPDVRKVLIANFKTGEFRADTPEEQKQLEKLSSTVTRFHELVAKNAAGKTTALMPVTRTGVMLNDIVEKYFKERSKTLKASTVSKHRSALNKFQTHHGNVDVGTLQDDNSADKYKTLLVDELEATTANDYIRILSAFFDYVHSNSAAKVLNPWSARIVKGARNQAESYEPFSNQELKKIFKAELYRAKMKLPDFYWGPLVALYTGARAEEIASLTPAQVLKEKGIVYIQILQGKTENAPRRIPVHDALVDLGFLEYVTLVRKAGFPLLFPHLIDGKNGFKKNMTRRFGVYLDSEDVKIIHALKVFHSFRHTAITALTNAQVNDGLKKALVGHDGKTKTSSHDDYVHLAQLTLPNLSRAINLLNFPIDLVGLRADSPSLLHAAQRRIAARKAMDEKKPLAALKR